MNDPYLEMSVTASVVSMRDTKRLCHPRDKGVFHILHTYHLGIFDPSMWCGLFLCPSEDIWKSPLSPFFVYIECETPLKGS